jgi:hypothetical protein
VAGPGAELLPIGVELMDDDVEVAQFHWQMHMMPIPLPPESLRRDQDAWETPLFAQLVNQLHLNSQTAGKARILAGMKPEAGAWLGAVPSPQLGTHLGNESFRIACALRLGCNVCEPHTCPCGDQVTAEGHHGLSCKFSAGRRSRHGGANEVIARALRSAEVPCVLEPAGCSRSDGKRPDGLTLVPWKRGQQLLWDFTCPDTFAPSHLPRTSLHAGRAAEEAAAAKRRKYERLEPQYKFMPVAVETSGAWDADGLSFIREVGVRIVAVTGEKRASMFLLQRLSLAVQRGNVASVLGTLPSGKTLDEIFLL